jgi:hypothetical protein
MKKIFLGLMAIAMISGTAIAINDGGGKKKAHKKAKTECKVKDCDPRTCDPKDCDPNKCDPKNCDLKKCEPTTIKLEDCSKKCTGK